jgi:hypothetical protein
MRPGNFSPLPLSIFAFVQKCDLLTEAVSIKFSYMRLILRQMNNQLVRVWMEVVLA